MTRICSGWVRLSQVQVPVSRWKYRKLYSCTDPTKGIGCPSKYSTVESFFRKLSIGCILGIWSSTRYSTAHLLDPRGPEAYESSNFRAHRCKAQNPGTFVGSPMIMIASFASTVGPGNFALKHDYLGGWSAAGKIVLIDGTREARHHHISSGPG